jgi:hypothetical protein
MARLSQATVPLRSESSLTIMTAESASRSVKPTASIASTVFWLAAAEQKRREK